MKVELNNKNYKSGKGTLLVPPTPGPAVEHTSYVSVLVSLSDN